MKKTAVILCLVMLITAMTACGNTGKDAQGPIVASNTPTGYSFNMDYETYGENLRSLTELPEIIWQSGGYSEGMDIVYFALGDYDDAFVYAVLDSKNRIFFIITASIFNEQNAHDPDMGKINEIYRLSFQALGLEITPEAIENALNDISSNLVDFEEGYSDIIFFEVSNISMYSYLYFDPNEEALFYYIQAGDKRQILN